MIGILKRFTRVLSPSPKDPWSRLRNHLPPGVLDALLDAGVAVYQVREDDDSVHAGDRGKWFVSTYSRFCDVEGVFTFTNTELEAWQQAVEAFGPYLKPTA